MRALPAALAAVVLVSGCTGDDESATQTITVTTPTTVTVTETTAGTTGGVPASGELPVAAFNAQAERVDEPWERDLRQTTDRFLALPAQESGNTSFQGTSSGDSGSVSLLVDGLGDDSVRARRYELTFTRRDDGTWKIESASWAQRCQRGRGHQTFSPEPCL
jgi:hypothetical protein